MKKILFVKLIEENHSIQKAVGCSRLQSGLQTPSDLKHTQLRFVT